jgi:hypothetical protein
LLNGRLTWGSLCTSKKIIECGEYGGEWNGEYGGEWNAVQNIMERKGMLTNFIWSWISIALDSIL